MSNTSKIENYVQAMGKGFAADRAGGLKVTYYLQLSGDGGGDWSVAVADRRCQVNAGRPAGADTQITMSTDNYMKLAAGHLDIRRAVQQGQVRIGGNQQLALKFVEIFPPWTSHLPPDRPPEVPAPAPSEPAISEDTPTVADYARTMPNGFRAHKAGNLRATYQFDISGVEGGTWTVTIANSTCSISNVRIDSPNVIISLTDKDFIKLAEGDLNTTRAFQQGRLKISGDLNVAAKIPDIFEAWADTVQTTPFPTPQPGPTPSPQPQPTEPAPKPTPPPPSAAVFPQLMNGSFDEYQPYVREGETKVWKEDQFPERYGQYWTLETIREKSGKRFHPMDSGVFGKFTQKYFRGGGRDYHIHGRHSQVFTSRYEFDLVLYQTIAAQPGRDYTFSGSLVSFFQGTSGPPVHDKIFKTLGIDPTGGHDYRAATVVWGERDGRDNEWRYPTLKIKAQAQAITVFIRLENKESDVGETELNIIHLDNFKLE